MQPIPPASLTHVKVINVISGGSDVCGLTYSAAKRLARAVHKSSRFELEPKLEAMAITVDDDDVCETEHHNGLVISLTINNCLLKRSYWSMGVVQPISSSKALSTVWDCVKKILLKKSIVLVGFSGEA